MSFKALKGQESAVSFLKRALKNNKLSHAYIFSGPDGVGKLLAALNFAKVLNCENQLMLEPCDKCSSCRKIDSLTHPDIYILRAEKKSGVIGIDEIRELIRNMSLKSFEARNRVCIIDGAQDMKREAANALLKTLEEPPADSILILITSNLEGLFTTIVSRSQIVKFFPLKRKEVEDILKNEYSMDAVKAYILSHLSGGRLGDALEFKNEDIFTWRSALINSVLQGLMAEVNFDEISKDSLRLQLDILLTWFRDILNTKIGVENSMLVNIDKKDVITGEAKLMSFDYLEDVISDIVSTMSYLDQNANPKLAMSVLAMKINEARHTCTK